MVVFNTVIVKKVLKILTVLTIFLYPISMVRASEPSFSFYPPGGVVANENNGFTVDILIDSAGEELVEAKFTITFDPEYLQLTKAERNNELFAQWPEDESTIDNTNGVVMLTGFSQSGTDDPYVTSGDSDVFARLTFEIIKSGETTLDWEYSGADGNFKTVLMKDGSPTQNVLDTRPESATFSIGVQPNTGIPWNKYVIVGGVVLILFGSFMMFSRPRMFRKKKGTLVIYEEE